MSTNSLQSLANDIRKKRNESPEAYAKSQADHIIERGKILDAVFTDRMKNYMAVLEEAKIQRYYFLHESREYLRLVGSDALGLKRMINFPVTEAELKKMNPEDMILLIDKYILRGYEVPPMEPNGLIHFNVNLDVLGPSAPPDFSDN